MYAVYNGVQDTRAFPEKFETRPILDERGVWRTTRKRLYFRGVLLGATQAAIKTKIDTFLATYADNNRDVGFYHDDGTQSPFFLETSTSLGGVKIIEREFPNLDDPGVYATGMPFRVAFEALYAANNLSPMIFRETLRFIGNGGPRRQWTPVFGGFSVPEIVETRTLCRCIQEGFALGLQGWPLVSDPLFPAIEDQDQREITEIGPEAAGANLAFVHYGMQWHYQFTSNAPLAGFPNFR